MKIQGKAKKKKGGGVEIYILGRLGVTRESTSTSDIWKGGGGGGEIRVDKIRKRKGVRWN